ncbi:hypothetical protein ACWD4G_33365 [Streptomyces sp. NPDC002643]
MRKSVGVVVSAAIAASLLGAMAPSASAAPKSYCSGSSTKAPKVKRCIAVDKGKYVKIKIGNFNKKAIKGQFGITCVGDGQHAVIVKKTPIKARSWWKSQRVTCPKNFRHHAFGWWMDTDGDVEYTPHVNF